MSRACRPALRPGVSGVTKAVLLVLAIVLTGAASFAVTLAVLRVVDPPALSAVAPRTTVWPTCTEDAACWNCQTMGNRVCGPDGGPSR